MCLELLSDGSSSSLFAPPGLHETSCSSLDVERGSDKDNKEDKDHTLSTRSTTTASIATKTTMSSLQFLRTPSVLLPASFQKDPLIDLTRMFFDEGNGVVHVKVRFGKELPQKPDEMATLDDYLWYHLSANYRKFLLYPRMVYFVSFCLFRMLYGFIFWMLLFNDTIPYKLYYPIILIFVDLILATWWRKRVKFQAILNNHMVDDLKARFLARGYKLDCYCYYDYDYEQGLEGPTRFTNLCFVIYPTSLDAQAFVRYKGDILLGEGFGTVHIHDTDFPKEKPKNLVTLDNDLWNDYAAKMIRRWFVNMNEDERSFTLYFTLYVLTAIAWYTVLAYYWWFGNIGHSGVILIGIFYFGTVALIMSPPLYMLTVWGGICFLLTLLKMILGIFISILACIGVKFRGSNNIQKDFTDRFQENGYKMVVVEEHGLVVFTPVGLLSSDHDTTTETV